MNKPRILSVALVLSLFLAPCHPVDSGILSRIDALVSFSDTDFGAEYLIEKRDPGGSISTSKVVMFRRDRSRQFLVLILEPPVDTGKGYLKSGESLWLYDPVGKSFTFTNAKERFENTSVRISDFNASNYAEDYRVVSQSSEKLGKFDCEVLSLESIRDSAPFAKVKIWVSRDSLVRKTEDYSLSGLLMRTTAVPTYQKVGGRWAPYSVVIIDNLKSKLISGKVEYERTTVTITKPSLRALPDSTYSKEYLERVAR
ncbi:MAG: outer membrane lipoprotein-sorting protein [Rectinemataceae bacterium]